MVALNKNCFWPYGKRFLQVDNYSSDKEAEADQEKSANEAYPLQVIFNEYLAYMMIVTKLDIRLFDITTGKLVSIFNNVFSDEENTK